MSCDVVIQAQNLGKCYKIYHRPEDRLKQYIFPQKTFYKPFWALRELSFEIKRGQCVGIMGQNGSGKSTLLQLITGILSPSEGNVTVKGRVAALLELGSGFNPEFSGRENVYLNGCLLGLTREEVEEKFEKIVAFADIGEHLDRPVKTYSSGILVRLAFAVQIMVEPDILIVDEALAVGDARFQLKCFKRLEELKANGTTILFVSHAIELIKTFCDNALVLDMGKYIFWGDTKTAVTKYYQILFPDQQEPFKEDIQHNSIECKVTATDGNLSSILLNKNDLQRTWGNGGAYINHAQITGVKHPNIIIRGTILTISLQVQLDHLKHNSIAEKENQIKNLIIGIRFDNNHGVPVFDIIHELSPKELHELEERNINTVDLQFEIEVPELRQGDYFITFGIAIGIIHQVTPLYSSDNVLILTLEPDNKILGQLRPKYQSKRIMEWAI